MANFMKSFWGETIVEWPFCVILGSIFQKSLNKEAALKRPSVISLAYRNIYENFCFLPSPSTAIKTILSNDSNDNHDNADNRQRINANQINSCFISRLYQPLLDPLAAVESQIPNLCQPLFN